MQDKWYCTACGAVGKLAEEFNFVRDPRSSDPQDGWHICRACDAIDRITSACDEPGCKREGTCGFPVNDARRYRRTCWEHSIFKQQRDAADANGAPSGHENTP